MTAVLGLDVGRHLGWAVVDFDSGAYLDAGTIDIDGDEIAERCANVAVCGTDLVRRWEPIEVGVEAGIIHGVHLNGADTLLKYHGALLVGLWRHHIAPATVAPSSLKKYATGNGRSDKAAMRLAAARRWPTAPILGPDAIDALWVADWARANAHLLHGEEM